MKKDKYYVYMLRCKDDSIYTGITNDLERRINEHKTKDIKAAKYTKSKGFKRLETYYITDTKSNASKLEYWIKKLSKDDKEKFMLTSNFDVFKERVSKDKYLKGKDI